MKYKLNKKSQLDHKLHLSLNELRRACPLKLRLKTAIWLLFASARKRGEPCRADSGEDVSSYGSEIFFSTAVFGYYI